MANSERQIALFKGESATVEIYILFENSEYKLKLIKDGKLIETIFASLKPIAYKKAVDLLLSIEVKGWKDAKS